MLFPWKVSAEEEYRRDPQLKKEEVAAIHEWIRALDYLPRIDEEMICHFLHACFYNVDQTKKTIETFYTYKTTMPEFFDNWDPNTQELQDTVNRILIAAPLPQPTPDGHRVLVLKLNDPSTERFIYPACVRWITMSCIHVLWERGIQPGYVIVYDAAGYTMSHLFKCSLSSVRNYINYGKNASPIRVVRIVFVNTSPVVKKLMTVVKPFLNKDLVNMMSFYTSADAFFSDFPPENVPQDYGGQGPPLLSLHRESAKIIAASKEWFLAEEKLRIDENLKNKKKDSMKVEKSFKKLEID